MAAEISRALLARLLDEATVSPEHEVCGLLLTLAPFAPSLPHDRRSVDQAIPATNVSPHPGDSFEIDPATLFAAIRAERAGGPRVIGHYHSHPRGPARPSPRDAAAALEPGRLWLILARGEATLWREKPGGPIEGAFEAVALSLLP